MDNKLRTDKVVDVKHLHISFRTFRGYPHVLNGGNLYVKKKERISIVGETGCGKTTTVNAIAQILAERTHSQVVQVIGRKIVLYRPAKDEAKRKILLP